MTHSKFASISLQWPLALTGHVWHMTDFAALIAAQQAPVAKRGPYNKEGGMMQRGVPMLLPFGAIFGWASITGIRGLWQTMRTGNAVLANGGPLRLHVAVSRSRSPVLFWFLVGATAFATIVSAGVTALMVYFLWPR